MGGETSDSIDESDPVQDLGSVGDWRLPNWVHRISGRAWLFVALAIVSLALQTALYARSGFGWGFSFESGRVARSRRDFAPDPPAPAVLWRGEGMRPEVEERIRHRRCRCRARRLVGERDLPGGDPNFGQRPPVSWVGDYYAGELTVIGLLELVGPVLIGRSIRGLRGATASPWTIRAGAALAVLTVAACGSTP